jgi:hypothetical protein
VPEIFVPISRIMLINHFLLVLNTQRIFHEAQKKREKSKMMMKDENRVPSDGKALNIKTPDVSG